MAKKKILIVDDEPALIVTLKDRLEFTGYEIITAADGQEGLEKARNDKPDLILLDLMLPKLDGYKVCRLLKFDEKYKHIPIIMLTARAQESDKKLGAEVGADSYMNKPFELTNILDKIKELLQQYESGN